MDTPELPPSDQPPSPESQPPESPTPDTSPPESPNFLTAQAPPPDPNAPLAPDDPLRYWYSTQQPPSQPMSTSRPFSEIWKVVWTQPDVMAYRDVLREADVSLNRSTKWIASTYGIALVLAFIILATVGVNNFNDFNTANNNSQFSQSTDTSVNTGSILCLGVICVPVVVAIALVLFFLFTVGIPHVVALVLGGKGRYEQTAFLYSAIYAPTLLIGGLGNLVPRVLVLQCLFYLVWFALFIYELVMQSVAIKAVHNLDWFRSIVAACSPLILGIGLAGLCFGLIFFGAIASS